MSVSSNFKKNVINYNNNSELIKKIIALKKNKRLSDRLSKRSLKFVKNLTFLSTHLMCSKCIEFAYKEAYNL